MQTLHLYIHVHDVLLKRLKNKFLNLYKYTYMLYFLKKMKYEFLNLYIHALVKFELKVTQRNK